MPLLSITMKDASAPRRRTGRPLSFDREQALQRAMLLFWRYGYDSTSLAQLTSAMGISPPSLYAAFGDKKQLFQEAVGRYSAGLAGWMDSVDAAATARDAVQSLLEGAAIGFTGPDTPAGCLIISAATNCSAASADVQAELAAIRRETEGRVRDRIQRDVDAGLLPRDADAPALAAMYMTLVQGMSNQARDGAPREKLLALGRAAMRAWPADAPA